jgi:hypothetical protein
MLAPVRIGMHSSASSTEFGYSAATLKRDHCSLRRPTVLEQFEVFGARINEVLPGRSFSLITRVSCVLCGSEPNVST